MAAWTGKYPKIRVVSYIPDAKSGLHGEVHVRPAAGQNISTTLHVRCNKALKDPNQYPIGTVFLIEAKLTNVKGGGEYLYSHEDWYYEVVSEPNSKNLRSTARRERGESHDPTRKSFEDAFKLFDERYRAKEDWQNWENNKAHKYAIKYESQLYPVKQIVSMVTGVPRGELFGGRYAGHANAVAVKEGFDVIELRPRNPDWCRDELILALDLYLQHRPTIPGKTSKEILALSEDLNRLGSRLSRPQTDTFRNPNGVYMKLMNFKALDPDYISSGRVGLKAGGRIDQEVWEQFAGDSLNCHRVAENIRAELGRSSNDVPSEVGDINEDDDYEAPEGKLLTRVHRARERNRKLVMRKKAQALKSTGALKCEACKFDFLASYGERGRGFIECHHSVPVAEMTPGTKTKLADLALLCANCHRMIHAGRPWLSLEELKVLRRPKA